MIFSKKEAYLAATRSDLKVFLRQSFHTIYPGKQFMDNWHIDAIVHCLELSIKGERPRLLINLPPRHLKSFIVSVVWPAFIIGTDPTAKIICISYSDELAKTLSRDFRRIIESEWYQLVFPHVMHSKMTECEFVTVDGGGRYATSVGGTLTGKGGDFIIIDDPIKPEDTHSDKVRQSTNEWYKSTLLSRLDDKKRSVLVLVMQRLHVNDLTGFVESSGGFHKLSLPAIAIMNEYIPIRGGEAYFRVKGEPLHCERDGMETLERIRDEVGPQIFAAQYQQRPESPEGALIKRKWIKVIDGPLEFEGNGNLSISIDSASSTAETADYSAISVVVSQQDGHHVIFAERGRWDYEMLLAKAMGYVHLYGEEINFIVEAASSGISLIHSLKKAELRCFHHFPKEDKMVRAAWALPIIYSGRLFIHNIEGQNAWVEPYLNELVSFPNSRFDDQVDSLIQILSWAENRFNPGGSFYSF
jgi:hypothetical protein